MNGSYLSSLIQRQAATYGDRVALKYRDYATASWMPVSWKQFEHFVLQTARALVALKVGVQENIGVFSQNKPECFYVDFGAFCSRVATVPMYATSSEVQIHYILNDAGIRILFVGEQYQYDIARRVQSIYAGLEQIVVFDKSVKRAEGDTQTLYYDEFLKMGDSSVLTEEVEARRMASSSDDIANILYTSGTTGESKGVMLHHSCYETTIPAHQKTTLYFLGQRCGGEFSTLDTYFRTRLGFLLLEYGCHTLRQSDSARHSENYKRSTPNSNVQRTSFLGKSVFGRVGENRRNKRAAQSIDARCHKNGKGTQHRLPDKR